MKKPERKSYRRRTVWANRYIKGLIHISELQEGDTKSVTDVVDIGQILDAKLININDATLG